MAAEFVLYPTVASGLSLATYRAPIPASEQWFLAPERPGESTLVLSGATVHSFWPLSVTSANPEYSQVMTDAKFQKLRTVVEHATVVEWMLLAEARVFTVVVSWAGMPTREYRGGALYWRVKLNFRIVSEETTT